jgi:hypothetical protein
VSDKQFKSGQKVKCIDASACDLSQDEIYTVKSQDEYVRLLGWGDNGYGPYRFEPVEPENQVTEVKAGDLIECVDDSDLGMRTGHITRGSLYRPDKLENNYLLIDGSWYHVSRFKHVNQHGAPDQPTNVHCGGPYIARSEYDRQGELLKKTGEALVKVEKERDDAKTWFSMTVDEIAQVRASLNHVEGQRAALIKERDSLKGDVNILKGLICEQKTKRQELLEENTRLLAENTMLQRAFKFPLPPRPALKAPSPPAWLRKGWWYAMDKYGGWLTFPSQPSVTDSGWKAGGYSSLPEEYQPDVPLERWREACWQVME